MKKLITILCIFYSLCASAQQHRKESYTIMNGNVSIAEKNVINAIIPLNSTTHFVSPEPISYVDISSQDIQGDLTEKNVFRLRPDESKFQEGDAFTITIVTQSYISVYRLKVTAREKDSSGAYVISINPNDAVQLNQSAVLNNQQFFDLGIMAMKKNRSIYNIETKAYGMKIFVKNIYSVGDYIMLEVGAKNKTNLQFDIDQIRFKIIDKHTVKATVSQDIELQPLYSMNNDDGQIIYKEWSNFYIFKKFTYPTQKLFEIEMTENQYSGRKINLKIEYNQILKSQQLN